MLCTATLQQKQGARKAGSERCDTETQNLGLGMLSVIQLHCCQTEVLTDYHPALTQLQPDAKYFVTCKGAIAAKFELSKAEQTLLEMHLGQPRTVNIPRPVLPKALLLAGG